MNRTRETARDYLTDTHADDGKTRESRAILQDADILLNIDPKEDCIYIAKNRDGERGAKLPYTMNGDYQRFEERHEPIKNRKY